MTNPVPHNLLTPGNLFDPIRELGALVAIARDSINRGDKWGMGCNPMTNELRVNIWIPNKANFDRLLTALVNEDLEHFHIGRWGNDNHHLYIAQGKAPNPTPD